AQGLFRRREIVSMQGDESGENVADHHAVRAPDLLGKPDAGLRLGQGIVPLAPPEQTQCLGSVVEGEVPLAAEFLAQATASLQRDLSLLHLVEIYQKSSPPKMWVVSVPGSLRSSIRH